MEFNDNIKQFAKKIEKIKDTLKTEEATKTSLILPFFQLLGYDVFNPYEFVPEFIADAGTKKGEKVDYAIIINNEPIMLIEAKSADTNLNNKHLNQLYRYFTVTKAKFAVLTNGIVYKFYTDLEEPNKMDDVPFLEINLLDLKDTYIKQIKKFCKDNFDIQDILDSASELKYVYLIKKVFQEQIDNPSDQFIKVLLNKGVYNGVKTQSVIDRFRGLIKLSFSQYINDLISDKLQNVFDMDSSINLSDDQEVGEALTNEEKQCKDIIINILKSKYNEKDIIYKKTSKYVSIQIGNSIRRWVCRIFIKQNQDNQFVLHKLSDYDNDFDFQEPNQLNLIKDHILYVADLCSKL